MATVAAAMATQAASMAASEAFEHIDLSSLLGHLTDAVPIAGESLIKSITSLGDNVNWGSITSSASKTLAGVKRGFRSVGHKAKSLMSKFGLGKHHSRHHGKKKNRIKSAVLSEWMNIQHLVQAANYTGSPLTMGVVSSTGDIQAIGRGANELIRSWTNSDTSATLGRALANTQTTQYEPASTNSNNSGVDSVPNSTVNNYNDHCKRVAESGFDDVLSEMNESPDVYAPKHYNATRQDMAATNQFTLVAKHKQLIRDATRGPTIMSAGDMMSSIGVAYFSNAILNMDDSLYSGGYTKFPSTGYSDVTQTDFDNAHPTWVQTMTKDLPFSVVVGDIGDTGASAFADDCTFTYYDGLNPATATQFDQMSYDTKLPVGVLLYVPPEMLTTRGTTWHKKDITSISSTINVSAQLNAVYNDGTTYYGDLGQVFVTYGVVTYQSGTYVFFSDHTVNARVEAEHDKSSMVAVASFALPAASICHSPDVAPAALVQCLTGHWEFTTPNTRGGGMSGMSVQSLTYAPTSATPSYKDKSTLQWVNASKGVPLYALIDQISFRVNDRITIGTVYAYIEYMMAKYADTIPLAFPILKSCFPKGEAAVENSMRSQDFTHSSYSNDPRLLSLITYLTYLNAMPPDMVNNYVNAVTGGGTVLMSSSSARQAMDSAQTIV
jgi:hypothetical protein